MGSYLGPEDITPATTPTSIDIPSITVNLPTLTSAEVSISKVGMTVEPTSYEITYQRQDDTGGNLGSPQTEIFAVVNPADEPVYTISGLTTGSWYVFTAVAKTNTITGNGRSFRIKLGSASFNGKVISGKINSKTVSTTGNKAFFTITAPADKSQYAIATRTFDAINISSTTGSTINTGYPYVDQYFKSSSTKYYAFGTSLFMDNILTSPKQGAGLGFFTNKEGTSGYFVLIETTGLSASQDRKSIRIVKADGTKVYKLKDSQKSTASTYDGIYGGSQYNIDIKVKISDTRVDMIVYINGFKILLSDQLTFGASKANYILYPTQNVSVLSSAGTAAFDYVYGMDIEASEFEDKNYIPNFYQGQFSNDLLNTSYGNITYSGFYGEDVYQTKKNNIDEFGTSVREIHKANIKFSSRPAFPIKWSVGSNRSATILGSKISNFGGEAYVLNNTSVTVPLSDNNLSSFYVVGNTLTPSGELEYSTDEQSTYTTREPVTFQSKWLQTLADVKSLATWIKSNVVNKGNIVQMEIFGNPLINVGDIISITYPYQGFDGTERFIITSINHSYNEGLTTSITCRLIVN